MDGGLKMEHMPRSAWPVGAWCCTYMGTYMGQPQEAQARYRPTAGLRAPWPKAMGIDTNVLYLQEDNAAAVTPCKFWSFEVITACHPNGAPLLEPRLFLCCGHPTGVWKY